MSNPSYNLGTDPAAPVGGGYPATGYTEPPVGTGDIYADPTQPGAIEYSAGSDSTSKTDAAKGEASNVKDTAVDAGKNVAGTAKEQASNVVSEAGYQAKGLLSSFSSELKGQAGTQQRRLGDTVHSLAKELGSMASSSDSPGMASDLARQASEKGGEIAHWLQSREPADLLEDVRGFARRRPVAFLAICGLAGVVAGRLTRGAVAANTSLDSKDEPRRLEASAPLGTDYSTAAVPAPVGYADPAVGYAGSEYPAGGYAAGTQGEYTDSGYAAGGVGEYPSGGYPLGSESGQAPTGEPGGYTR